MEKIFALLKTTKPLLRQTGAPGGMIARGNTAKSVKNELTQIAESAASYGISLADYLPQAQRKEVYADG